MRVILGIDLGTTHSAVGVVDSGFPILLANEDGERITPSVVWFGPTGEVEVGRKALRRKVTDPTSVITSVKRRMGQDQQGASALDVVGKSAEEVSAEILKELRRIAEWRLDTKVEKAVITVPAYFNDAQRTATKRAGELAGLEVVRILNEPTAAALSHGLDKAAEKRTVAVYDLGGGTFDLSILEIENGVFQVLATRGDTQLGGDDLDRLLCDFLSEGFQKLPREIDERLLAEARKAKEALAESNSYTVRLPFFVEEESLEKEVTREQLNTLAKGWIEKTIKCCERALLDSQLNKDEIDCVVLVGGSTRMLAVQQAVADFFGKKPDTSQHPDEAIAIGATMQGGVLSGALREMVLLDVTPLSLGLETFGGLMNVIIPRNTTIPCKAGEMFTNAADYQESMQIRVLQGEREMARDNWELGKFEFSMAPAPKGQARVGVQFKIDADGILEILARDTKEQRDVVVEIADAAVNVDDEMVGAMVGESVDHAFEDMAERIFTEAKIKADELLPAVEMVFDQGLVEEDEAQPIKQAAENVREAMAAKDANALKAAVKILDEVTEAPAARLLEKAMEAALAKQLGE